MIKLSLVISKFLSDGEKLNTFLLKSINTIISFFLIILEILLSVTKGEKKYTYY